MYNKILISLGILTYSLAVPIILDSTVELVESVVGNGVIGVVNKYVVTLLVIRTFFT